MIDIDRRNILVFKLFRPQGHALYMQRSTFKSEMFLSDEILFSGK